jgi:hypothetical protein
MLLYNRNGNFILTINGGHMTIRLETDEPRDSVKIDQTNPLWQSIKEHEYAINDLVENWYTRLLDRLKGNLDVDYGEDK